MPIASFTEMSASPVHFLHQLYFQLLSTYMLESVSISNLKLTASSFTSQILFLTISGSNSLFSISVLKEVGVLSLLLEHCQLHPSTLHFRAKVSDVLRALEGVSDEEVFSPLSFGLS